MHIIQNGSEDKLPIDIQEPVDNIIKKEGYKTYTINSKITSTKGDSYLAELFEVDVKGKTSDGDKETHLFIKKSYPDENMPLVLLSECFSKELFVYNDLFKVYHELQEDANIPKDERFNMIKSYDESSPTAIILENLILKGYRTMNREEVLPIKFTELTVQQLARFHGLSFVLEKKQPEYIKEKVQKYKLSFRADDEAFLQYIKNSMKITIQHLEGEAKKKMEAYSEIMAERHVEYINDSTSTVCCLCHGDYRQVNTLVKETNGEISEIIPIDYQIIGYGVPVHDLLFLIFLGSDQQFRKDHLENLKNLYFDSLSKYLNFFNIDVETVYPRIEYERIFKERLDYGLMACFIFFPLVFVSKDECVDLTKDNFTDWSFKPNKIFMERMRGLIDDYIKWGYM